MRVGQPDIPTGRGSVLPQRHSSIMHGAHCHLSVFSISTERDIRRDVAHFRGRRKAEDGTSEADGEGRGLGALGDFHFLPTPRFPPHVHHHYIGSRIRSFYLINSNACRIITREKNKNCSTACINIRPPSGNQFRRTLSCKPTAKFQVSENKPPDTVKQTNESRFCFCSWAAGGKRGRYIQPHLVKLLADIHVDIQLKTFLLLFVYQWHFPEKPCRRIPPTQPDGWYVFWV